MVGWTPSIMVPRFFATPLHLTAFLDTAKSCFTSSVTTSPPISSAMFRPMRERERERSWCVCGEEKFLRWSEEKK